MATLESVKEKLQSLIDAANATTGNEDTDLTSAVNVLIAGFLNGGSSEFLRKLTFMEEDGETVAGELTVAPKYSCDYSATPKLTKESTEDTDYTHTGWSLTPEGNVQNSILGNIPGDLTLYPVFTPSTRHYTVRFFDGETLLYTEKIPYHGSSDYTYDKIGAYFQGWNPAPENIEGDMDCYGVWEFASFATDSWAQITANSRAGKAAEYYSVGDERDNNFVFADGHGEKITLKIADIGKKKYGDDYIDCITVAAITPFTDSLMAYRTEEDIFLSYPVSDVFNYLYDTVLEQALAGLNIRPITKSYNVRNYGSTAETVQSGDFSIWSLTRADIGANGYVAALPIFAEYGDSDSEIQEARILKLRSGEAVDYWLMDVEDSSHAYVVKKDGSISNYHASKENAYVVFCFCI